ncbi:MAG: ribosome-associated translation inhibitor RaiA [Candidatus Eiseniibacteriota bacterium]|jgi:putative sigma-54 modulation protein
MDVVFTARHFELAPHLKEQIERKLSKLDGIIGQATEARVILTVENYRHQAEVQITARGQDFIAASEAGDMLSATDQVLDRLERQLRRFKDRRVRRRRDGRRAPSPEEVAAVASTAGGEPAAPLDALPALTRHDQVSTRPMTIDEAIEQLDESGAEYLLFSNTESERLTVLYRRADGTFGLIEPTK